MSENTGITLVALVITIIVLLILAGVALNMVMGDNGIIARAKIAKEKNNRASAIEAVQMAWMQVETDYQLSSDKTATRDQYFTKERVGEKLSGGRIAEDEENCFVYDEHGVSQVIYENDNKDKYTVQIASNGTASIVEVSNVTGKDEFVSSIHTVSIIEGETYQVQTSESLTWTSTDDSKVTITPGEGTETMTGVAVGSATVTGVNDNGTPVVTCTITVREAQDSFVATTHNVQIVEGETYQLTSSSNLTWSSTNSDVASIEETNQGIKDVVTITGNAEGSAKITGVNEKGTIVVDCTVIVTEETDSLVSTTHQVQIIEGENYQLTSSSNLTWTSSNNNIVSVQANQANVTMTGNAEGSATITGVNEKGTTVVECTITVATAASPSSTYVWKRYDAEQTNIYSYKIVGETSNGGYQGNYYGGIMSGYSECSACLYATNYYHFDNKNGLFTLINPEWKPIKGLNDCSTRYDLMRHKFFYVIPACVCSNYYNAQIAYLTQSSRNNSSLLTMVGPKYANNNNSYWPSFICISFESYIASTTYSNSNTNETTVTSSNPSAYPSNGYSGGYWYVLQGTE